MKIVSARSSSNNLAKVVNSYDEMESQSFPEDSDLSEKR